MLALTSAFIGMAAASKVGDQLGNVTGTPTWKYLLFDHNGGLAAIDTSGKSVWSCASCGEARDLLPNGHVVTIVHGTGLVEKDATCKDVKTANAYTADGHEARIDAINSNRVVGITQQACVNQKNISCQGITHWDRSTGEETMPIDLGDHFDPSKDWGYLSSQDDWMHTNCASTGFQRNFIVGIRHLSAIVSFAYGSGAKQWVLSSEIGSNFTFENDDDKFFNCHDAHQLPNGNLLLYDNGNKRNGAPAFRTTVTGRCSDAVQQTCPKTSVTACKACVDAHASTLKNDCQNWPHDAYQGCGSSPSPGPAPPSPAPSPTSTYSRALEYELDFKTMTVSKVFEYRTEASHAKGAARRLANGNTLVTCPECRGTSAEKSQFPPSTSGSGVVFEVDKMAKEVSRVELATDSTEGSLYRAQAIASLPSTSSVEIIV